VVVVGCTAAALVFLWLRSAAVPKPVGGCPSCPPQVDTLDVLRTTLAVMAFVGALLTGLYAYRKQLVAEGDARRADAQQFADRYTMAAEQLGAEQPAVRLAGAHAMARLADDWVEQRQTCIDVLCAYLRLPGPDVEGIRRAERQVRGTIVRVVADHLRKDAAVSWSVASIDLRGAQLGTSNFSRAAFAGSVDFSGATFIGSAWFGDATFAGPVSFRGATFMRRAHFHRAVFSGDFTSTQATFDGYAWFSEARFARPVRFDGATFRGLAMFNHATYESSVWFRKAEFGKEASFDGARFRKGGSFAGAVLHGDADRPELRPAEVVGELDPGPFVLAGAGAPPD
jgi:uncharacterized protein YjbI with pentapeptide repeats